MDRNRSSMGFNEPVTNEEIFEYRETNLPFKMDQREISSKRIKVVICLSSAQYICTVCSSLKEVLPDMEVEENGNKITVSGYPPEPNFGKNSVLAIVQKHDRHAKLK